MKSCQNNLEKILMEEIFVSNTNNILMEIDKKYTRKNSYTSNGVATRSFKASGIGFSSKESLTEDSINDALFDSHNNIIIPCNKKSSNLIKNDISNIKELLDFECISNENYKDILQEIIEEIESKNIKVNKLIYQNTNLKYKLINTTLDNYIRGNKNTCTIEAILESRDVKESIIIDLPKSEFCKEKVLSNIHYLKYKEDKNLPYKEDKQYKIMFNNQIFGYICFIFTYLISGITLTSNKDFYELIKTKKIKDTIRIIENSYLNKRLDCKYDMEGNRRFPIEIFNYGTLNHIFTDSYSSKTFDFLNTSSCFREDVKSYPVSMPTSIEIANGHESKIIEHLDEINDDYFMIDEIVGGEAGINPYNGKINIVCNGYIQNGYQRGEKLKIYVKTDILELFNNITTMTKEKYYFSDCLILSPFVLVENINFTKI